METNPFEKVSPAEWVFITHFSRKPETAKLLSFGLQLVVILLLLSLAWMFYEWKLDFAKRGCEVFCNCTTRVLAGNGSTMVMVV